MNTVDFFYSHSKRHNMWLIGLLCCLSLTANAEPLSTDESIQPEPLVLTLSDKWLDSHHTRPNQFQKLHGSASEPLIEPSKPTSTDIGCSMDVSPVMTIDSSLTNRFVGKCNFNYQY